MGLNASGRSFSLFKKLIFGAKSRIPNKLEESHIL
jgi:hypothetical protein